MLLLVDSVVSGRPDFVRRMSSCTVTLYSSLISLLCSVDVGKSCKWVVEPHFDLSFWEGNEAAAPPEPSQIIVPSSSALRSLPGHPPFVRCASPPRSFTSMLNSKSMSSNAEPKKRYIGLFGNMAKRRQQAKQAAAAPRRPAR